MKLAICAAALPLLLLGQIVSAAAPVFGTTTESKYAREAAPAKGKAIIYIYRRHDDAGPVSPTIWLNTYEVGRLVPGSFTAWQLSPGRLEIRADGADSSTLSLTSEAGKVYLIRISVTPTVDGANARIARIAPDAGRSDMAATQLLKNPRDVTAVVVAPPPPKPAAAPPPKPAAAPAPAPETAQATAESLAPGGIGLLLKSGSLTLSDDSQSAAGFNFDVDDKASGLYAVEAYFQFRSGYTLGAEIVSYTADFTQAGTNNKNDVDVFILFANGKKYFRTDSHVQPYIGAGIGSASTDVSGTTIKGSTSGLAYQLMAGVEYRTKNFGVVAEFKSISADTEDDNNQKLDVSGAGFFVGLAFHF